MNLKNSTPKSTDYNSTDCKAGGLKNVDIQNKTIALQWSWIRTLYNSYFHEWKLILLYYLRL